ncbi:hypothetical protein M231_05928 [Tremella mesenterica]|uniref:Uncharacterized protein n=1 Tax=Tremella mesenterica TaxID=5217 RepID=A0A4V1M3G3_TREME|nr:hypothetical protein M231_05928 [Tremella mesenterica]
MVMTIDRTINAIDLLLAQINKDISLKFSSGGEQSEIHDINHGFDILVGGAGTLEMIQFTNQRLINQNSLKLAFQYPLTCETIASEVASVLVFIRTSIRKFRWISPADFRLDQIIRPSDMIPVVQGFYSGSLSTTKETIQFFRNVFRYQLSLGISNPIMISILSEELSRSINGPSRDPLKRLDLALNMLRQCDTTTPDTGPRDDGPLTEWNRPTRLPTRQPKRLPTRDRGRDVPVGMFRVEEVPTKSSLQTPGKTMRSHGPPSGKIVSLPLKPMNGSSVNPIDRGARLGRVPQYDTQQQTSGVIIRPALPFAPVTVHDPYLPSTSHEGHGDSRTLTSVPIDLDTFPDPTSNGNTDCIQGVRPLNFSYGDAYKTYNWSINPRNQHTETPSHPVHES